MVSIGMCKKHLLDVLRLETYRIKPSLNGILTNAGVEADWQIICGVYEHTDTVTVEIVEKVKH